MVSPPEPFDPAENPPLDDFYPSDVISFGDVFTKQDFLDCVEAGGFIDYDGFGHPSNGTHEDTRHTIYPSKCRSQFPHDATHICWYNR